MIVVALGSSRLKRTLSSSFAAFGFAAIVAASAVARAEDAPPAESATPAPKEKETPAPESVLPERAEKKALDERVKKATTTEPKSVVARYEELQKLFSALLSTLEENLEKASKTGALERESLDLSQKKERALHLLEQTEARRARAELRLRELEAARNPSKATAPNAPPAAAKSEEPTKAAPSEPAKTMAPVKTEEKKATK